MASITEIGSLYIAIRASAEGLKGDIQNAVDDAKSVMEKGASALAVTQTAEAIKGQQIGADALMKTADEASKAGRAISEHIQQGTAVANQSLKEMQDLNQPSTWPQPGQPAPAR